MDNKNDRIEVFDGEGNPIASSQKPIELSDVKGNLISIEDAKTALPHNSDLIQRAIDGKKDAFNELYMQSYRYVFFVIRQYIPDDETTYDAIQETFLKVYKNIRDLREPAAYYGWLTSIARNTAIDVLRTKPTETSLVYEEKDETLIKDDDAHRDVSLDIEAVLKEMDPEDANLLSLVYYDGMRVSQIAKMQGTPATTVYSRLNRAKRNLKSQLAIHGIDKAIYSGNFVSIITIAIRNIIGTALLSLAIAQQILNSIIGKKGKKELAIARIIKQHQKQMALKIASCIVAISVATSVITVLSLVDWKNFLDQTKEKEIVEYHYTTEYKDSSGTDNSSGGSQNGFWQNLFGGNSSEKDASSDTSSTTSGGFWQNLFGGNSSEKDASSDTSSTTSGGFWGNLFGGSKTDTDNESSTESKGFWEGLFGSKDDDSSENSSVNDSNSSHENENTTSSDNTTSNDTTSEDEGVTDGSQSESSASSSSPSVPSHTPSSSVSSTTTSSTPTIPTVPDGFVADCDESEYNILGNEFSNYNIAMQGDWIYYCSATYANEEGGLYKIKKDGTDKQLIKKGLSSLKYNYINVVGPWIYYISGDTVGRILTDGTGYKSLGGSKITTLQVYNGYAYFKYSESQSNNGGFSKMNLNTFEISSCNTTYFTDKYRIYTDYDNEYYEIYDLKTGSLAATISTSYGSINKCCNSGLIIGKYVFDLNNLNAEPVNFHVNISDYTKATYFYSPYKGGCVGGWYGEIMDGWYYNKFTGIIYMSDLSQQNWPFPWKCIDSVYGPLRTKQYAVFGDYVYYIDGTTLHKILPDGTNHTVIG